MNDHYPSSELLKNYLAGRCTSEEVRQIEAWYNAFETQPDLEQSHPETQHPAYSQHILQQIQQRIDHLEPHSFNPSEKRIWKLGGRWLWLLSGVAATLTLFLSFWYFSRQQVSSLPATGASAPAWTVLENRSKAVLRRQLADGSVVWLNPATRLRYPQRFAPSIRTVELEGEAFFEVRRDPTRPFVIHSGKLKTEVLGTTFNIRAYRNSPRFEVSVVSGQVAVSVVDQKKVLLTARQQAIFNPKAESLAKKALPRRAPTQLWEPATIEFEWTSLEQVATALEETFGVKVRFRNPALQRCKLRADFTNMRLPAILELLCKTTEATYTLNGQLIELDGAGCP